MEKKVDDRLRIGQKISALRREQGLTQQELANRTGLTRTHLSRIENGLYGASIDMLQLIAEALGKKIDMV